MAILTERECGHVVEEGTVVCPECGYDPDCLCCILYGTGKEEEEDERDYGSGATV